MDHSALLLLVTIIVATIVLKAHALYNPKGDVVLATDQDFKKEVLKDKGIVIVEFFGKLRYNYIWWTSFICSPELFLLILLNKLLGVGIAKVLHQNMKRPRNYSKE